MFPVHEAASRLGKPLAKAVIKAHILTGDDCVGKMGKASEQYLINCADKGTLLSEKT